MTKQLLCGHLCSQFILTTMKKKYPALSGCFCLARAETWLIDPVRYAEVFVLQKCLGDILYCSQRLATERKTTSLILQKTAPSFFWLQLILSANKQAIDTADLAVCRLVHKRLSLFRRQIE